MNVEAGILTHKGFPLEYAYELGYHTVAKQLCRIWHRSLALGNIDKNCIRVIRYRERHGTHIAHIWTYPLDETGNLKSYYWSIPRSIDLERR